MGLFVCFVVCVCVFVCLFFGCCFFFFFFLFFSEVVVVVISDMEKFLFIHSFFYLFNDTHNTFS